MDYRMTPEETRIFLGTDWRAFALLHERLEQELRAAGERDAYILTADGVVAWAIDPEFCFRAPRAAEETWPMAPPALPGYLCEVCLDAPAVACVPAPWGGDMGICVACGGLPPDVPAAAWDAVPACLICAQPPGPDEDATAYVQHCMDSGHPLRPGAWQLRPGARIYL